MYERRGGSAVSQYTVCMCVCVSVCVCVCVWSFGYYEVISFLTVGVRCLIDDHVKVEYNFAGV